MPQWIPVPPIAGNIFLVSKGGFLDYVPDREVESLAWHCAQARVPHGAPIRRGEGANHRLIARNSVSTLEE